MGSVKNFILAFCTFLAIAAVTSCSNEEETFFFDEEGVPVAVNSQRVSEEQFADMVNGAGWVETVTHEIFSNGDYDKRDYWEDMDGGASRLSPAITSTRATPSPNIFYLIFFQRRE